MQKLKFGFLLFCAFFVCAGSTAAQQTVSPEKQSLIREFMRATGGEKQFAELMNLMIGFQEKQTPEAISAQLEKDENLTPAQKEELRRTMKESSARVGSRLREFFAKELNAARVLEEIIIPLYDRNFTDAELRDLIAFYDSPTGKKMVALAPKMTMETLTAFNEKVTPKLMDFIKRVTDEELALMKADAEGKVKKGRKPGDQ